MARLLPSRGIQQPDSDSAQRELRPLRGTGLPPNRVSEQPDSDSAQQELRPPEGATPVAMQSGTAYGILRRSFCFARSQDEHPATLMIARTQEPG